MILVSAILITFNEEKAIARCLQSVLWADEIVVVDAGSLDRTKILCLDPSAPWAKKIRFFERTWTGFRDQRNFALDSARHDWVFAIDADEACSPELAQAIQQLLMLASGPPGLAYKVRRVEYFLGKPIHFGIWNPSYQDRFFHKKGVRYINNVHEFPKFNCEPARLHEPIHHWPDFTPDKFLDKMNRYTTIEAQDRVRAGQRTNVFRIISAFPAMFLKNYFYYKARKDGMHGFVISVLEGISRAVRHVKIWHYSRHSGDP